MCVKIYGLVSALFPYVPSIMCVNRYSCLLERSHQAMNNNARATKHFCCAYYSWYIGDQPKAFLRLFWRTHSISKVYFTNVICWFSMFWLKRLPNSVFTYSKYHYDILPDLIMQFYIFFNIIWWTSVNFQTFSHGCLVRRAAFIYACFGK